MKKINIKFFEIFVLIILSFTPLFWYKNANSLALGHDMGYPVNPIIHFQDRLFAWTNRFGLGTDQQIALGGFFIHGLEAFIQLITKNIFITQKIDFILWMFLPMISIYVLLNYLYSDKKYYFIRVFGSIFYVFNHFMLQAWSIAERTKFSFATALPLAIYFYLLYQDKRLSSVRSSFLIALTFFVFNGGGTPPFFGSFFVFIICCLLFYVRKNNYVEQIKHHLLLLVIFLFVNAYWLFPLASLTVGSYSQKLDEAGGITGVMSWIDALSKNTTLVNITRLQGIPDWYDNPQHPYSKTFLDSSVITIFSFLIAALYLCSFLFIKKDSPHKKVVIFWLLVGLISMLFTAGSNSPFGNLFKWLVVYAPGFTVFRTPFYKFGLLLWLAYSIILPLSLYSLVDRFKNFKIKSFLYIFLIFTFLIYSYPYFTGYHFNFLEKPYSTMVNLPDYVVDAGKYLDKINSGKILALPSQERDKLVDQYSWGYWSTSSIFSSLTKASVLVNDHSKSDSERSFINYLYKYLSRSEFDNFLYLAKILDIKYLLLREDYTDKDDEIENFKSILAGNNLFKKIETFGAWSVYEINSQDLDSKAYRIDFYRSDELSSILPLGIPGSILVDTKVEQPTIARFFCEGCVKGYYYWPVDSDPEKYWPGTLLFRLVAASEKRKLDSFSDINSKTEYLSSLALKRLREMDFMYITNKFTEKKITAAVELYLAALNEITANLDKLQNSTSYEKYLINKTYITLLDAKSFSYRILPKLYKDPATYSKLESSISQIDLLIDRLKGFVLLSDDNKLVFLIDGIKKGDYGIYMEKDIYEEFRTDKPNQENQVFLGEISFEDKLTTFDFATNKDRNIILEGNRNFTVQSSDSKLSCFEYKFFGLDGGAYKLSFDQKIINGTPLWFYFVTSGINQKDEVVPSTQNTLTHNEYDLYPNIETGDGTIKLCLKSDSGSKSVSEVQNLKLIRQIEPQIVLKRKLGAKELSGGSISNFTKVNNTKYKVVIEKNNDRFEIIDFPEKLSEGWVMNETDFERFRSFGFIDSWVITKPGKYEFEVYYLPQRLYIIGWVISTISICILALKKS